MQLSHHQRTELTIKVGKTMADEDERKTYFMLERQPEIENIETLKQLWKNSLRIFR
jgi:hypothetical protein